ncbi:MAG: transcription antitermination factor NusB [Candidatus Acidiferrales bacterium]
MSIRRKAREYALQMLYQWEVSGQKPHAVESAFWKGARSEKNTRVFANELFEGAVGWVKEIDKLLGQHAQNWRLDRMAAIDRNILRLGVYELRYCSDAPPKVVINEALELAKKFCDAEGPAFVNGILDSVNKAVEKENGKGKMEKGNA